MDIRKAAVNPRAQGRAGYFHGALEHEGVCFGREGYPELPEIVEHAESRGVPIELNTNCGLITEERIEALLDAIAEVYASMFGPDPIQYRVERGLLDFSEEMDIIIQQVVGTLVEARLLTTDRDPTTGRPTIEVAQQLFTQPGINLLVVTGGEAVVEAARKTTNNAPRRTCAVTRT